MKNIKHKTNYIYFMFKSFSGEEWEQLGKVQIKLTEKSYYWDLIHITELIEKIYNSYYWEILPMDFKICYSDKENNFIIMNNKKIQKWFKLFRTYQLLTNNGGYNYTTFWHLMVSMFAQIYITIQEERSIKSNEKNVKETGKN